MADIDSQLVRQVRETEAMAQALAGSLRNLATNLVTFIQDIRLMSFRFHEGLERLHRLEGHAQRRKKRRKKPTRKGRRK